MYNEELKLRFIQDSVLSPAATVTTCNVFKFFEKFENEWGADLCTRTAEQLQPVFDNLVGLRINARWAKMMVVKRYVKWCLANNVPGACDGALKVTNIGIEKVKRQTVANPAHLQRCLDLTFANEDLLTIDNLYRCFLWLAYSGMEEEDIYTLKCSDIDLANMEVKYRRRNNTLPLYRESMKSLRHCSTCTEFRVMHPMYTYPVYQSRLAGDKLMRGLKCELGWKQVRVAISKKVRESYPKTGIQLSYTRVRLSGIFYRAEELERFGREPDFTQYVVYQMDGKEYKLGPGKTQTVKYRQLLKDYNDDYLRWKLAWYN